MNIHQLEYLRELIHQGSFSRAAAVLQISQPALSIQMKKLEEESGLVLIDRQARPLQLSAKGRIFYEHASEILDRLDALDSLSLQLAEDVTGVLRLGIIHTLAPYLLPLFIEEINQQYPDLELMVEELTTEDIVQQIKSGKMDGGIIASPVSVKNLHFRTLFYEKFFLYVSNKHALFQQEEISLEEMDLEEVWYLKEGNCFTNQVNSICTLAGKASVSGKLKFRSNSIESLRRIVEKKKGITFIPELATIEIPAEYEEMIKSIGGVEPFREISLISKPNTTKIQLLDALTEVLLTQLPERMKRKPERWIVDTGIQV